MYRIMTKGTKIDKTSKYYKIFTQKINNVASDGIKSARNDFVFYIFFDWFDLIGSHQRRRIDFICEQDL